MWTGTARNGERREARGILRQNATMCEKAKCNTGAPYNKANSQLKWARFPILMA